MSATIGETVNALTARFAAGGIDNPRLDARVLVGHALDVDPSKLFARSGDVFPADTAAALEAMAVRRLAHEPVSRIRGHREFWGLSFAIGPATLDPRPDTETLVEVALRARQPGRAARLLDLGTGTGCILLAILSDWPEATGIGIDMSLDALAVARTNATRLGLAARATFAPGNWCNGLTERYDIVLSNPPYISDAEMSQLAPEVARFDPPQALRGGADGLNAYRGLIPQLRDRLAPGGTALLEVGAGQAQAVAEMMAAQHLPRTAFYEDLGGIARVVAGSAA